MKDISDFAFVISRKRLCRKEPKYLRYLYCTNLIFQLPIAAQQKNPKLIALKIISYHLSKFCGLTKLSWRLLPGVSHVIEDRYSGGWGHLEAWPDQIPKWFLLSLCLPPQWKGLAGPLSFFPWDLSLAWHAQGSTVDSFSQSKSHKIFHDLITLGVTPTDFFHVLYWSHIHCGRGQCKVGRYDSPGRGHL